MKRFVCLMLALVMCMCLGLCACGTATTDENGYRVDGNGRFVYIKEAPDNAFHNLAYDRDTHIVYYVDLMGNQGYVSPYQIYEDGVIYGAVYENGEIVPKPYALGITFEMLGLASKYLG